MVRPLLLMLRTYVAAWRPPDPDRGDSPVPTAIIIAGLAVLALGILLVANEAIDDWTTLIPGSGDAPDNT
ncbi:hypothetical protein [Plantactinospora sp. GCM10030261]|uniref:hypothetical protein n=1 Tax=Plantactinospora sp. GCM10030261 TaxID=3273420 RepID=UPI0036153B6D